MSICDLCQLSSPSGCTKLSNEACLKDALKLIKASATNGDVIKTLFPDIKVYGRSGYAHPLDKSSVLLEHMSSDWWNALYKAGDTGGINTKKS